MSSCPVRRRVREQSGSTLIELLVAMPLAVLLVGVTFTLLGTAGRRQQDVERRSQALTQAQGGLERLTREARQAEWVYVRSSSVVDLLTPVRTGGAAASVAKLVRYDCSTSACRRSEGAATSYPPPAAPAFTSAAVVVGTPEDDAPSRDGRLLDHDVFSPRRVDASGALVEDWVDPTVLRVRLRLALRPLAGSERERAFGLQDAIALRNRSAFR